MKEIKRDIRKMNKARVARYISRKGITSKAEIAAELGLSMPTTLQNVKELIEAGIVVESGEYGSTGGRKAKALSIASDIGYVAGIDVTANHLTFALVNMKRELLRWERIRVPFEDSFAYYERMGEMLREFLESTEDVGNENAAGDRMTVPGNESTTWETNRRKINPEKICGVGISLPGIVNREEKLLIQSQVLGISNISFRNLQSVIGYPFELENDANSAACAEFYEGSKNTIYLSLSNTVGGAVYLHDGLYTGENFKGGEFGHMVIEKSGKKCYCGKRGCVDVYCSAKVLQSMTNDNLEAFFEALRNGDEACTEVWEKYLDSLAVTVTNLRMLFDCDIILGGYVGGYLEEFLPQLQQRIMGYNNFDLDTSYLRTGRYKLEAAAYGVTMRFVDAFFDALEE